MASRPPIRPSSQRFAALAERWWDEAGPLAPLHKLNPVRLGLHPRPALRASRPRSAAPRSRSPASPRSTSAAAAACCASRSPGSAPRSPASTSTPASIEAARAPRARGRARDRLPRSPPPRSWSAERRALRPGLRHGGGRARRRPGGLSRGLRGAGRGPAAAWSWRRSTARFRAFALGIVAAEYVLGWLPRGTHQLAALRAPLGGGARAAPRRPAHRRPHRRRLRPAARPLPPEPRSRGQLHAVRDARLSRGPGAPTQRDLAAGSDRSALLRHVGTFANGL